MKYNAYILPGFGAGAKMFKQLQLADCNINFLEWEEPNGAKTYQEYAQNIVLPCIKKDKPVVLLGFSMGGMVMAELARIINPEKLIFISAAKNTQELPKGVKILLKITKPYYYLNQKRVICLINTIGPFIVMFNKEYKVLFKVMKKKLPKGIVKFGFQSFANWKLKDNPSQKYLHIQGTRDKLIPAKNIKNKILVDSGHDFIILKNSVRVNELINNYMKEVVV